MFTWSSVCVIGKFSLEKQQGESQRQECLGPIFSQCFLDLRISLEALHGWLELAGSIAKLESLANINVRVYKR